MADLPRPILILLVVAAVLLAAFPFVGDRFYIQLITQMMILATFAMSSRSVGWLYRTCQLRACSLLRPWRLHFGNSDKRYRPCLAMGDIADHDCCMRPCCVSDWMAIDPHIRCLFHHGDVGIRADDLLFFQ